MPAAAASGYAGRGVRKGLIDGSRRRRGGFNHHGRGGRSRSRSDRRVALRHRDLVPAVSVVVTEISLRSTSLPAVFFAITTILCGP